MTAWNPFSRRMPEGWNERMNARLREAARGRVLGEGWGSARGWRERHALLAGDPRLLLRLARRFRQAAIVLLSPGRPATLAACRRPQAGAAAGAGRRTSTKAAAAAKQSSPATKKAGT